MSMMTSVLSAFLSILSIVAFFASALLVRSRGEKSGMSAAYCAGAIVLASRDAIYLVFSYVMPIGQLFSFFWVLQTANYLGLVLMLVGAMGLRKPSALLRVGVVGLVLLVVASMIVSRAQLSVNRFLLTAADMVFVALVFFGSFARGSGSDSAKDAAAAGGESATFASGEGSSPVTAGEAKFAELLKGIEPTLAERGSVAGGVMLSLLSIVLFMVIALIPVIIGNYDGALSGICMIVGIVVFVALLVIGMKMANAGSIKALIPLIKDNIADQLYKDEEILAVATSRRLGLDFWMHGMTPTGIIAFTKYRVFLLLFASAFKSPKKALIKREGVTVIICDGSNADQARWGGLMMPITLHLMSTKLTLRPDGQGSPVSWAVFKFGKNWDTLREIRARMVKR